MARTVNAAVGALVLVLALAGCRPSPPAEDGSDGERAAGPMEAELTSYPLLDRASAVAPAPDGGVWAGTETAGLVRWQPDGASYRHHPLPERFDDGLGSGGVSSLAATDSGAVWVATGHPRINEHEAAGGHGVLRFDGEEWTRWTAADGLPHDRVTSVAVAGDGAVWAATAAGLARFDGDGWTAHTAVDGLAHDETVRVAAGPDGTVWAVTRGETLTGDGTRKRTDYGLARFDGEQWTSWSSDGDLAAEHLGALAVGPDGRVWVDVAFGPNASAGDEIGVARFDGEEWTRSTIAEGHHVRNANALAVAGDGAVWAGTDHGVYRFDGQQWIGRGTGAGLGDETVHAVVAGDDGTVWAATHRGVRHFDGDAWTSWTTDTSPPDRSRSVAADGDGTVWAGMGPGVARFDGQQWTTYAPEDEEGLRGFGGYAVATGQDGSAWAASHDALGEVARFDGQRWVAVTVEDGLADSTVDALAVGADGTVWAATSQLQADDGPDVGLSRFDGQQWTSWTSDDRLPDASVTALAAGDDGTVWAGTQQSGVWRFDGEQATTYTVDDGLASNEVNGVAVADDGTLWAATRHGASRFDGQAWATFAEEDGLPASQVNAVAVGGDGTVWAAVSNHSKVGDGGRGGLSAFDGEQWTTWTADDGLVDDWVTSVTVGADDTVWVATHNGLSQVIPEEG